jgi:Spy/CpxP family protein refolding chaperone
MSPIRKHVLIALTVFGLGSAAVAAQAQTAAPQGRPADAATHQERAAKWSEHFAKRQAKLHDALQLNGSQESAWANYQAAIKPQAKGMRGDRAAWATMPAPARMQQMIAMSKQRTAMMESHLGALNTFYSVLTPAQKKVFDENSRGGHGHHRDGSMKG